MSDISIGAYQPKQTNNAWGAVIQGIGNLIDTGLGFIQQNKQNNFASDEAKAQRLFESQEAQKARDFQKFMFDYDSPEYRKERLLEAGYSPWFSEQNGAGSAVASPIPSGAAASAPANFVNSNFGGLGRAIVDANLAQSQMALNSANVDKVNRDSSVSEMRAAKEFVDAYKELYSIDKDAAKRFAESSNYGFTNHGSYFHQQIDNAMAESDLQLARNNLEYQLRLKFGDKEAGTKIAEMESIINRTFGELGFLNAKAELTRSEIALNQKRAFEIGARVANLMAQARLFSSDAAINEGIKNYVIDSYRFRSGMEGMQHGEMQADYSSRSYVRDWKLTDASKSRQRWNYKQSPEGNYLGALLNGFTSNAKLSFGGNFNFNRNKSNSFNRGIHDNRVFNMGNWY